MFPGAYEKVAWNAPTFRVGERVFAMFADDHIAAKGARSASARKAARPRPRKRSIRR